MEKSLYGGPSSSQQSEVDSKKPTPVGKLALQAAQTMGAVAAELEADPSPQHQQQHKASQPQPQALSSGVAAGREAPSTHTSALAMHAAVVGSGPTGVAINPQPPVCPSQEHKHTGALVLQASNICSACTGVPLNAPSVYPRDLPQQQQQQQLQRNHEATAPRASATSTGRADDSDVFLRFTEDLP